MYKSFEKGAEILFPRKCPVCDDIIVPKGKLICPECIEKVSLVNEPCCRKCGKEIYDEQAEYCDDCKNKVHYFEWGAAAINYDAVGRKLIADLKYHNKRDNADFAANMIAKRCSLQLSLMKADAIVPVPLFWWKRRVRGFNQSELIACKLGELVEMPVYSDMLVRTRNTKPQKNLEHLQRRKNLMGAFQVRYMPDNVKSVILIDDIYTTGSTIDACSTALKEAGIKKVYFISACIGNCN